MKTKVVAIDERTYGSRASIRARVRRIYKTFARVLSGHRAASERVEENKLLFDFVTDVVVSPIVSKKQYPFASQKKYRAWHRQTTLGLTQACPMTWDGGTRLTVGMAQKIVNLFTKDLWALGMIGPSEEGHLDVPLDRERLRVIGKQANLGQLPAWTNIDSYEEYFGIQQAFRRLCGRGKLGHTTPIIAEALLWQGGVEDKGIADGG